MAQHEKILKMMPSGAMVLCHTGIHESKKQKVYVCLKSGGNCLLWVELICCYCWVIGEGKGVGCSVKVVLLCSSAYENLYETFILREIPK